MPVTGKKGEGEGYLPKFILVFLLIVLAIAIIFTVMKNLGLK